MALTKELLNILDNEEQPFPKRLKIADNAFKSVELPIQHREAVLLKWLGRFIKTNETEAWDLLLGWLTSQQMQDLNRNDITRDDVQNLINMIIKCTKRSQELNWSTIVKCVTALIDNRNFQMFFKHDLEMYCKFVSSILSKLDNEDQIIIFITNEQLFNRNIISNEGFYTFFLEECLECLGCIVERFCNNKTIFEEISKLVEKCIFHRNFKNFSLYLKNIFDQETDAVEKPSQLPKLLVKKLQNIYEAKNVDPKYVYKLIFHSFCSAYNNNFDMIYKFFIISVETLGFNLHTYFNISKLKKFQNSTSSLNKSISILTQLCSILIDNTNDLNHKVDNIMFTEFLQNITTTIISLTKCPDNNIYEFLRYIIILDPLVVEKILNEILIYVMLSNKKATKAQYNKFLVSLFEVFAKLHRIPNLLSKMIRTLRAALEGDFKSEAKVLDFSGIIENIHEAPNYVAKDIMSFEVLNYFTQCITTLPSSWQVMNVFKTLTFHLEESVDKDLPPLADTKIVYIEVISMLMCQFLCSVRITEHTVPTTVVEKFVKTMDELKEILKKFGTALVNVEHNAMLMRAYLNICYSWGELYITLAYYAINGEVILQKTIDSDSSACNITYIHSYLTRDQWCLISQRIANFGEKPCKLIMHKLYVQKFRAMLLFEESVPEEIVSSIRTSVLSSIDDNWKDIICDQLVIDQIVTKANNLTHIVELVLKDTIETNNLERLKLFINSNQLIGSMLYICLRQLNKAFKRKHKRGQPPVKISLTSKLFPYITEELFLSKEMTNTKEIIDVFIKEIEIESRNSNNEVISCVNEKDLSNYMDIIKAIPVTLCNNSNIQQVLILYLICVLSDLRSSVLQNIELIDKCENIIIGLAINCNDFLKSLVKPFHTTEIVVNLFTRYIEIFTLIARSTFKNEESLGLFREGIEFLTKNVKHDRYLQCATVVLDGIIKCKKTKVEKKNRLMEYQEEICKYITELVKQQETPDVKQSTQAYALTLKHYLTKDSDDFQELLPYLDAYINGISQHVKSNEQIPGAVELFTTILRNKSKLKSIEEDIVLKTWNCCQNISVDDKEQDEYSKLVVLIFEHIPNEQFPDIANDLLQVTAQALKNNDIKQFIKKLKIWCAVLSSNFNTTKMKTWQQILERLIFETILVYFRNNISCETVYEDVVKFETNIIQNVHLMLTASLVEAVLITVSVMMTNPSKSFTHTFGLSISLLESLIKYRKPIIMDYLPTYLQRYRSLLSKLCIESNSDTKLQPNDVQQLSDCAHKLEKLTSRLADCDRHLMRISPYLIADILKHYEEITLLPNVKIHLNNCLYSLMSLCDEHAVSYLMRVLSTASTEMFKVSYENYKKYYKFTGKV